jgi:formyltetrahydrofolate hydrolase
LQDLADVAAKFGIEYRHLPLASKDAAGKLAQEQALEAVLEEHNIDLVVLARWVWLCILLSRCIMSVLTRQAVHACNT